MNNESRDHRWYHNNIDNNDQCIYPNDGDMCIYIVGTASDSLEYLIIFRDLPDKTLRCRLSLFEPKYIGLSGSEYDLILSDKVKLMNILADTWNKVKDFLKNEYEYPEYKEYNKDLSKLPLNPPNYLLLNN